MNWQTRTVQVRAGAPNVRFKSSAHHLELQNFRLAGFAALLCVCHFPGDFLHHHSGAGDRRGYRGKEERFTASLAQRRNRGRGAGVPRGDPRRANRMARHNVYAYVPVRGKAARRARRVRHSDDGELRRRRRGPSRLER